MKAMENRRHMHATVTPSYLWNGTNWTEIYPANTLPPGRAAAGRPLMPWTRSCYWSVGTVPPSWVDTWLLASEPCGPLLRLLALMMIQKILIDSFAPGEAFVRAMPKLDGRLVQLPT